MKLSKKFEDSDRTASGSTAERAQASKSRSRFHRISWKQAFGEIASPAIRLHRYRSAHNRLLLDALCKMDCSGTRRGDL